MPATIGQSTSEARAIPQWQAQNLAHRACPEARPGEMQCELLILNKSPQDKEPGWGARDIEAAYNLPSSSKGSGQIVAIVDADDNPNVASDLAVYRRHYGLPKAKFYKYNQDGQQSHYPERQHGAGALRSISTSRWFRPAVRTARSISSSRTTAAVRVLTRQKTKP